jgi:hypothetical protein
MFKMYVSFSLVANSSKAAILKLNYFKVTGYGLFDL